MSFGRSQAVATLLAAAALGVVPSLAHAQKKSRDLITREEIMGTTQKDGNLYQAIKALRPHFIAPPRGIKSFGGGAIGEVAVYVDRVRQAGLDDLVNITASSVAEVRYLDPTRSQEEYGVTANGGAIVIKSYKAPASKDTLTPIKPR